MQATAVKTRYETLRSLAFGSISAAYAGVGAAFANPVRIIKITNLTDVNLLVSYNGIDNHDVVAANGFYLYDYASNMAARGGNLEQATGERVYVKQEAGAATGGSVYVTIIYAATN